MFPEGYAAVPNSVSRENLDEENKKSAGLNFLKSAELLGSFPEEEGDEAFDIVHLLFHFLTNPSSSTPALWWAALTCAMAVGRILEIGLESCNGPNQYYNRPVNRAQYKFLLTADHYWDVYVAFMVPLIIDAAARIVLLFFIAFGEEHEELLKKIMTDKLEVFLFFCDIFGVVPFFVQLFYYHPRNIQMQDMPEIALVLLTVLELLITGRIFRFLKDIPAVRAIRIALSRSAPHLVLPLFFFFVFNITAGVLFYFIEPCYNFEQCFWVDLFSATFYSIVTMTTSNLFFSPLKIKSYLPI